MTSFAPWHTLRMACGVLGLAGSPPLVPCALAAESGLSEYVLGFAVPMSGYTPPPGVYFSDTYFVYSGLWQKDLTTKVTYNFLANAAIFSWFPDAKVLGGSLGFAATVAYVGVRNSADLPVKDPLGATSQRLLNDSLNGIANTRFSAILGWSEGEHNWNVNLTGFAPTGRYDRKEIAFTSLNRPALDIKGAYTFLSQQTNTEVTAALGLTLNAINEATSYQTGAELHFEWVLNQHFKNGLAAGVGGYFYQQVTADGGAGALLGPYKGRVAAVGPLLSYTFKAEAQQVTVSGRWFREFGAVNRVQGDSIFTSLAFAL